MRAIVAFARDEAGDWVARLACGHRQHTRHDPPFVERPWVLDEAGRRSRIGAELPCPGCAASAIPDGYRPYRRTPVFDEASVPKGLLRRHSTRRGVWGRIEVVAGSLDYRIHAPFDRCERLTPERPGVIVPEIEHHLALDGPVGFFVAFLGPGGESP